MKIALDLDDVVLDFVGNLVHVLNTEYDADLSIDDITEWDLSTILDPVVGENWWAWWEQRDWLWALAPAVPGAIGGIRTLRQEGHYLEIVTSKPEWAEAQTFRWLGKWRPPVQSLTIIDMETAKWEVSDADLLIDDKPQNVEEWMKQGREAWLFARPHNRTERERFPVVVHDWHDIVGRVRDATS